MPTSPRPSTPSGRAWAYIQRAKDRLPSLGPRVSTAERSASMASSPSSYRPTNPSPSGDKEASVGAEWLLTKSSWRVLTAAEADEDQCPMTSSAELDAQFEELLRDGASVETSMEETAAANVEYRRPRLGAK